MSHNITIIKPRSRILSVDWKEIWRYRELFLFLVWRDVKVKYKQTALGALWAIIVPFVQMLIFTVLFGKVAKLPTDGLDPQIYYYSGLILWTYFATSVTFSGNSMVQNRNLLTKIYFPRLIMPTAPTIASLVDFIIAFFILIIMMIYFGIAISWTVIFLPFFIIIALGTAVGTGLVFTSLNVKYRDIGFALPFIVQIWMYASVIVPYSKLPQSWGDLRYLYGLNPMGGAIEGFRWCLLNLNMQTTRMIDGVVQNIPVEFPWIMISISFGSMILILLFGIWYFRRMEDTFADIV